MEAIQIIVHPEVEAIIKKWGIESTDEEAYIFPHLRDDMSPEESYKVVKNLTWLINHHMKEIAKDAGIEKPVTTYYARHSFATILKNSGAPMAMISQALGHSSIATTQSYLAGFEDDQLKEATSVLMKFKKSEEGTG